MIKNLTINGLLMGQGTNYTITRAKGFESADVRVSSSPLPSQHGGMVARALWGLRKISIEFLLRSDTVANYAALRRAFFTAFDLPRGGATVPMQIVTFDNKSLETNVQLTLIEATHEPGRVSFGEARVELISPDPNIISQTEIETDVLLAEAGGIAIPFAVPFSLPVTGGSEIVVNSGSGIYYPTIRIYGPVSNPRVRNSTLNKLFALNYTILAGDYVTVDMEDQTVILTSTHGSLVADLDSTSDFWYIKQGNNTIQFSSDTYDATAYAAIFWRESYLGI